MTAKIRQTRSPFSVTTGTCTSTIMPVSTKPRTIRIESMWNMKTWNKLRADWDLDNEIEGMVVLDPKKQVEEHNEDWSDLDFTDDE